MGKGRNTDIVNPINPPDDKELSFSGSRQVYKDITNPAVSGVGKEVNIDTAALNQMQDLYGQGTGVNLTDDTRVQKDEAESNSGAINFTKALLMKSLGKGVLGLGELAGYVVNVQDWGIQNLWGGKVENPSNAFSEYFRDKSKKIDENFKFNTEEGKFDAGDVGEGVASTISSTVQFLPLGFGVGGMIGKAFAGVKLGEEAAFITQMVTMNRAEAQQASMGVYDKVYNDQLAKYGDTDEGKKKAKEDAVNAYNTTSNLYAINMLFNATSTAKFLKGDPFGITRLERNLTGRELVNSLKHETGQEALEEGISNVWEKAGEAVGKGSTLSKYFWNNGNVFNSDAAKELVSKDTFENAFWGGVGGATNTLGQHIVNNYRKVQGDDGQIRTYNQEQDRLFDVWNDTKKQFEQIGARPNDILSITHSQKQVNEKHKEISVLKESAQKAYQSGDKRTGDALAEKANGLKSKIVEYQAYNSFETGTTKTLLDQYNTVKNLSEADAKAQNLTVDVKTDGTYGDSDYRVKAGQAIASITESEKAYNASKGYLNSNEVFNNIMSVKQLESVVSKINDNIKEQRNLAVNTILNDNELSSLLKNSEGNIIDLNGSTATDEQRLIGNDVVAKAAGKYTEVEKLSDLLQIQKDAQQALQEQRLTLHRATSKESQKLLVKQRKFIAELSNGKKDSKQLIAEYKEKGEDTSASIKEYNESLEGLATMMDVRNQQAQQRSKEKARTEVKEKVKRTNTPVTTRDNKEGERILPEQVGNQTAFPTNPSGKIPTAVPTTLAEEVGGYNDFSESTSEDSLADFIAPDTTKDQVSIDELFNTTPFVNEAQVNNTTPLNTEFKLETVDALNAYFNPNTIKSLNPTNSIIDDITQKQQELEKLKNLLVALRNEGYENPTIFHAAQLLNTWINNEGIAKGIISRMFKIYTIDNNLNMDFDRFWNIISDVSTYESNLPDTDSNEVRNEVDKLVEQYFTYEKTYPANKLAYLSQNFTVKDGVITNTNVNPQYLYILNPVNVQVGLGIRMTYGDMNTPFTFKQKTGAAITATFNEYVKMKGWTPNMQEYKDNVPIAIYDSNNVFIGYVHTVSFAFSKNTDSIRQYRNQIVQSTKEDGSLDLRGTVESRGDGELMFSNTNKKLNENNPHWQIAVQRTDGLYDNNGNLIPTEQIYQKNFQPVAGKVYDLRLVKNNLEGKPVYVALPIDHAKIDNKQVDMLIEAVRIYTTQDKNNPLIKSIKDSTGFSILEAENLEKFFNMYINTFKLIQADRAGTIHEIATRNIHRGTGTPYINFIASTGRITFGITGQTTFNSTTIGDSNVNKSLQNLRNVLEKKKANVKINLLKNPNQQIAYFEKGKLTTKNYKEHVGEQLQTNVQSVNVGTEEEPVMATMLQPVIKFNIDFGYQLGQSSDKKDEVVGVENIKPIIEPVKPVTEIVTEFDDLLDEELDIAPSFNPVVNTEVSDKLTTLMSDYTIKGITLGQQYQLVDYLYNIISLELNQKGNLDGKQILGELKDKLNFFIDSETSKLKAKIAKQEAAKKAFSEMTVDGIDVKLNKITALLEQSNRQLEAINRLNVESEQDKLFNQAFDKLTQLTGAVVKKQSTKNRDVKPSELEQNKGSELQLVDSKEDDITIEEQSEKIYAKQSYEENPADSISFQLKRFMSGINQVGVDGKNKYGFLDVPLYINFRECFSVVKTICSNTVSDYDVMIDKLQEHYEQYPFLKQFVERLQKENKDIKKQFVSTMSQATVNMTFVTYKAGANGLKVSVFNANSSNKQQIIRDNWNSNSFNTDLTVNLEGKWYVNQEKADELREQLKQWIPRLIAKDFDSKDVEKVKEEAVYLQEFVKEFGIDLHAKVAELIVSGELMVNGKKVPYRNQLTGNYTGRLVHELVQALNTTEIEDGDSILKRVPFLGTLVKNESYYNNYVEANSFRAEEKQIYNYTNNHYAFDRARELTSDNAIRQQYRETSFAKNSMYLSLLELPQFQKLFQLEILSPVALKDLLNKSFGDTDIQSLSDIDHEITKLGMFTSTNGEQEMTVNDVTYRTMRAFSPTMSDKSQMTSLHTAIRKLSRAELGDSDSPIPVETLDYVFEQTVLGELLRIFNHKIGANIKGYDEGAENFYFWHKLNNLLVGDITVSDKIRAYRGQITEERLIQNLKQDGIYEAILNELNDSIIELVDAKVKEWTKTGIDKKGISQDYLKRFSEGNKVDLTARDFVIGNLVTNANYFMLFAGDPAQYYKKGDNFEQISSNTFTNIGKRLANQIAPGIDLADKYSNNYLHVFLEDPKSYAENIAYLTRVLDDKEFDKTKFDSFNDAKAQESWVKKQYPNSKAYFDIDSADAQEFTTWKEHIYVIKQLGKIPDSDLKFENADLDNLTELIEGNIPFEQFNAQQKELLAKIMQPMKPVYTNMYKQDDADVMRVQYIKSSSVPLIPQFTEGLEIDNLRLFMENVELKKSKTVRASYSTANKVGDVTKSLNIWNKDSNNKYAIGTVRDLSIEDIDKLVGSSILPLSRKGFRIQQSIPFKTGKKKKDSISMGTQATKTLFADIRSMDGFRLEGRPPMNGFELEKEYNELYKELYKELRSNFLNEIGVNADMSITDKSKFLGKLQELLKDEALARNYGLADIEALDLIKDENGKIVNFKVPLWLSNSAERYENLINAIINSRIVKVKFPGYSYVVASEEGIKVKDIRSIPSTNKIVWTSKWKGKLKANQILVPSKFRDNRGNIIDLFTKTSGEDYVYITQTEAGFKFKEDKFDEKLLKMFTFRIPTSGKMSMSSVEIAGFLPYEMGDVMFGSKNLTKQKGLDYDVDKENGYSYAHKVDVTTGNLVVDNSEKVRELKNKIIDIHHAVLANQQVAKSNFQPLGFDVAAESAKFIEKNKVKDSKEFYPLSDSYQKAKLISASSGKMQTGISSLAVTFHAQVQRLQLETYQDKQGKEHSMTMTSYYRSMDDEGNITYLPATITFGNTSRPLQLGNDRTIDGNRSISECLSEWQNFSVDNEKEQILAKINLNEITSNAYSPLVLYGYDQQYSEKYGKKLSIPNTFLSQPVLVAYVKALRDKSSIIANYTKDKELVSAVEALKSIGANEEAVSLLANNWGTSYINARYDNILDAETMMSIIDGSYVGEDKGLLAAYTMLKFQRLNIMGQAIQNIQSLINTDSKGVKGTLVESTTKIDKIDDLIFKNNYTFGNLVISHAGQLLVNSSIGHAVDYGLRTTKLFTNDNNLFPIHQLEDIFNEIGNIIQNADERSEKVIENNKLITKELRKFINTHILGTVFNNQREDSLGVAELRYDLFVMLKDNKGKTIKDSLASYLNKVRSNGYTNSLLNSLTTDITNANYSLIKYNNSGDANNDEIRLYNAFNQMIIDATPLEDFNGTKFTSKDLAEALIQYSFLNGNVQEAIEFTKFIPISYLELIGVNSELRNLDLRKLLNFKGLIDVTDFTTQFVQHNAELVKNRYQSAKLLQEAEDKTFVENQLFKGTTINTLESFRMAGDNPMQPRFITVKSKGSNREWNIFKYNSSNFKYERISNLGVFGMSEYQADTNEAQSVIDIYNNFKGNTVVENAVSTAKKSVTDKLKTVDDLLSSIIESDNYLSPIAKELLNKSDYKFEFVSHEKAIAGGYKGQADYNISTIQIDEDLINQDDFEATVIEEIIHSIAQLAIYQTFNPTTAEQKAVLTPIQRQVQGLYKRTTEEVEKIYGAGTLNKFRQLMSEGKGLPAPQHMWGENTEFTAEDVRLLYTLYDMNEFVARTLSDKSSMLKLANIKFNSNKTLLQRMMDIISNAFKALGITTKDSLLEEIMSTNMSYLREITGESNYTPLTFNFNNSESIDLIVTGQKTSTTRKTNETGLKASESGIQTIGTELVRITYHGELTVEEADKVLGKSLRDERSNVIKSDMQSYLDGNGKRHVFGIQLVNPVSFLNSLKTKKKFNNIDINFVDNFLPESQKSSIVYENGKLSINEGVFRQRFRDKTFAVSQEFVESNGVRSTMNAINESTFQNVDEYTRWLLYRNTSPLTRNISETRGEFENKLNKYALDKLNEFKYGKNTKVSDALDDFGDNKTIDNVINDFLSEELTNNVNINNPESIKDFTPNSSYTYVDFVKDNKNKSVLVKYDKYSTPFNAIITGNVEDVSSGNDELGDFSYVGVQVKTSTGKLLTVNPFFEITGNLVNLELLQNTPTPNLIRKIKKEFSVSNKLQLSTKENPLKIYSDGSDIKGTGKLGFGAAINYNGKIYKLSGIENSVEVFRLKELHPDSEFSNPTMEMLALVSVLNTFKNTSEHIEINQDYVGAINYEGLWEYSATQNSSQRAKSAWKPKKDYIKTLVNSAVKLIKQIETNGGSVNINWVKGHSGNIMNDQADSAAKDRRNYNNIKDILISTDKKSFTSVDKIKAKGTFRNKPVQFVDVIPTTKDKPVAMKNNGTEILIAESIFRQKFDEKAWTNSATQKDGSKSTPLAINIFKTFDEFLTFALIHEVKHDSIKKLDIETIGQYEDRINNAALEDLRNNYNNITLSLNPIESNNNLERNPNFEVLYTKTGIKTIALKKNSEQYRKARQIIAEINKANLNSISISNRLVLRKGKEEQVEYVKYNDNISALTTDVRTFRNNLTDINKQLFIELQSQDLIKIKC